MKPTLESVYALARLSGRDVTQAIKDLRLMGAPTFDALGCALRSEYDLSKLSEARLIVVGHYYHVVRALVAAYGPMQVLEDLESLSNLISVFESWCCSHPCRLGGSLAPFSKGLICLGIADALRGRGATEAQRIFGLAGPTHAAGLRQALTPTHNGQKNYMQDSLSALQDSPSSMAREAWRSLIAWGLAMPTLRELEKELELPASHHATTLLGSIGDELQEQYLLRMPIPPGHWPVDVCRGVHEISQEMTSSFRDLILTSIAGRDTVLPAVRLMGYWSTMVGRAMALELVEAFLHQILVEGVPVTLNRLHQCEDLTSTIIHGLASLKHALAGTIEGELLTLKMRNFADVWFETNNHLEQSGRGSVRRDLIALLR